ncbi:MAG: recombinase family protein [Clostridia bacterium]|nr:recombinase family protein [Clostridia bacterium]
MNTFAYARVSAADQNLNRQIDSFIQFGVEKRRIYCDKKSGKDFDRTGYNRLLKKIKKGDLLIIKSIDRLGRNYDMIIEEWARITRTVGADILVLDMPMLDTRVRGNDLTGRLISNIVLQLLSYVAQKERENINARQKEGIASAKLRGVKFGRPLIPMPEDFAQRVTEYKSKKITIADAMANTGMKKSTFYERMRLFRKRTA